MLSKSQIAAAISEETGIGKQLITNVLNDLAALAADEVEAGNDFVVPGIAKIAYTYRAPQAKGAKYKKGDTYVGFGGVETVAEADSKPVTERITLKAQPTGLLNKVKPGTKPEVQKAFMKTKTAKAIRARKAK